MVDPISLLVASAIALGVLLLVLRWLIKREKRQLMIEREIRRRTDQEVYRRLLEGDDEREVDEPMTHF